MSTTFTPYLRRTLEAVPGAVGCAFLDWDGEAVDQVAASSVDELKLVGAHYGIILSQVQRWLNLYHFGEAQEIILSHERADILIHVVADGYYVVIVVQEGGHLGTALIHIRELARALHREIE